MSKLRGKDVGHVEGAGEGSPNPAPDGLLSKKCRRLVELAYLRGKVHSRGGGFHFTQLVGWDYLEPDGTPTLKGRTYYERNIAVS